MSKTLEELGYEKEEYGVSYTMFSKQVDYEGYLHNSVTFLRKKKVIKTDLHIITMEELKAIYKYCEDNKWI